MRNRSAENRDEQSLCKYSRNFQHSIAQQWSVFKIMFRNNNLHHAFAQYKNDWRVCFQEIFNAFLNSYFATSLRSSNNVTKVIATKRFKEGKSLHEVYVVLHRHALSIIDCCLHIKISYHEYVVAFFPFLNICYKKQIHKRIHVTKLKSH